MVSTEIFRETSFLPLSYPTICKVLLQKQLPFTTREIASDSYLSVFRVKTLCLFFISKALRLWVLSQAKAIRVSTLAKTKLVCKTLNWRIKVSLVISWRRIFKSLLLPFYVNVTDTGYSFWDQLCNFLHKFTRIVLSVHKLNKPGKFW